MDEYTETGTLVGRLARCKKGDGVLAVPGEPAKVVLEMTDSPRTGWVDYLDEAERNRDAAASLSLVRTMEQNGGQSIRVLGSRRIVMAFAPEQDDPSLLRTVVMLLRAAAIAANARTGGERDRHGRREDHRGHRAAWQDRRHPEVRRPHHQERREDHQPVRRHQTSIR